jgi:hypothetical protein
MQVWWWLLIFHPTHTNDLLLSIWYAESAAAFDLTRSGKDSQMIQQWQTATNVFRTARFIPAVEYLTACRLRYMVMQQAFPLLSEYDIIIVPSMAEEPMALTSGQSLYHATSWYSCCRCCPPSITFIGVNYTVRQQ